MIASPSRRFMQFLWYNTFLFCCVLPLLFYVFLWVAYLVCMFYALKFNKTHFSKKKKTKKQKELQWPNLTSYQYLPIPDVVQGIVKVCSTHRPNQNNLLHSNRFSCTKGSYKLIRKTTQAHTQRRAAGELLTCIYLILLTNPIDLTKE